MLTEITDSPEYTPPFFSQIVSYTNMPRRPVFYYYFFFSFITTLLYHTYPYLSILIFKLYYQTFALLNLNNVFT